MGGFELQIALRKQESYSKKKKVARNPKNCSKSEKLLKSCRATYGQP